MRAVHYKDFIAGHGYRHTLAFKVLGRYLVVTWVWS